MPIGRGISSNILPQAVSHLPSQGVNLLCREGNSLLGHWKTETNLENLFPRLVVFCLLLSSLSFTPTKRYEEVDGVRKEKERLTTDHQHHIF